MKQPNTINWPFGLLVRFVLRVREVPVSIPGTAHVVAACYVLLPAVVRSPVWFGGHELGS